MYKSREKWRLSTGTAATINRVGAIILLVIGGMATGIGLYQEAGGGIYGLGDIVGGAILITLGLMIIETYRPNGSRQIRFVFGALMLVLMATLLYVQFWLER